MLGGFYLGGFYPGESPHEYVTSTTTSTSSTSSSTSVSISTSSTSSSISTSTTILDVNMIPRATINQYKPRPIRWRAV